MEGRVRKLVRELKEGEPVIVRNFGAGEKWLKGTVEKRVGFTNYRIKVGILIRSSRIRGVRES